MNTARQIPAPPQLPLSTYGWTFWFPAMIAGTVAVLTALAIPGGKPFALGILLLTLAVLAFYRDFPRPIPTEANVLVAPADGKVTEMTRIDFHPAFNGPALRVGIFLSVLDVHINRSPCDAVVLWTRYEEGLFLDARHLDSGTKNQSNTLCLGDPATGRPICVVRQIVGAIARRIIAPMSPGDRLARGERFGMIAFGSRTELILPNPETWELAVPLNAHVRGGRDVLLRPKA